MSECVKRNCDFLKQIKRPLRKLTRVKILNKATPENIDAISEIALNFLRGNIPVSSKNLKKLRRYQHSIRKIAQKSRSRRDRKRIINQEGGFLPLLVSPLLTVIGNVIGKALSKRV